VTRVIGASTSEFKDQWINELVSAGFPLMPLFPGTKTSIEQDWQHQFPDPTQTPQEFPDNYGVITPAGVLVIDIDPKTKNDETGENGWTAFIRLQTDLGIGAGDLNTFTVRTRTYPNGEQGLHYYFSIPTGLNLYQGLKQYPGVQIHIKGTYHVGPGSIHPDTKETYIVVNGSPKKLKEAPIQLTTAYMRNLERHSGSVVEFTDDEETQGRFIDFLKTRDPAVQGSGGEKWTYLTAAAGRDFNLSEGVTYQLMWDIWNPTCSPPWDEKGLAKKVANAYNYAKDSAGNMHKSAMFDKVERPATQTADKETREHQRKLDRRMADIKAGIHWKTKDKKWKRTREIEEPELENALVNVTNHFFRPHYGTYESELYNLVRFDTFTKKIEVTRPAPWHGPDRGKYWTDMDTTNLQNWLSAVKGWDPPEGMVRKGVDTVADLKRYHSVKEYFKGLTWDGTPRIEELFIKYAGAVDNVYTRAVGRCFMVAMVARIMNPGCQHDVVLVLEGDQGIGKSKFCRVLGGEWYAAIHLDPHNKDTVVGLLGKMLVELAEMTYNKKTDVDAVKFFASNTHDTVRLPYGRISEDIPRQCVLVGTTNERGAYLRDQTGNRRFWPIETTAFDLEGLRIDRDQLFAEALVCFDKGEPWYLTDNIAMEIAELEQKKRTEVDVWVEAVEQFLIREAKAGKFHAHFTTTQIASEILNLTAQQTDAYVTKRIANTMQALGWEKTRYRSEGAQKHGYKNPNYEQELDGAVLGI
jgi:predicted P-loop ATPase